MTPQLRSQIWHLMVVCTSAPRSDPAPKSLSARFPKDPGSDGNGTNRQAHPGICGKADPQIDGVTPNLTRFFATCRPPPYLYSCSNAVILFELFGNQLNLDPIHTHERRSTFYKYTHLTPQRQKRNLSRLSKNGSACDIHLG